MSNGIELHKELVFIEFFDGNIVPSRADNMQTMFDILSDSGKFIMVGEEIYAKNQVKRSFKGKINNTDVFIAGHPSGVQRELKNILKDRNEKGFTTNGPEHLRDIYIETKK